MTRVFISYSHDSGAHIDRVVALADQLRNDGIDVRLDQYSPHPPEGWPRWMEHEIRDADFVLLICTPTYRLRFDGRSPPGTGNGVTWEGLLAQQILYDAGARNYKLIPVLFEHGTTDDIPVSVRAFTHHRLPAGYEDLYRHLTDQPRRPPPPVGQLRRLPPEPRPSVLAGPTVDNRGATIGQQLNVSGSLTLGTVNVTPPPRPPPAPAPTAPTSSAPPTPATILLLSANTPNPSHPPELELELQAINDALQRSRLRDRYAPSLSLAATFARVIHELDDHDPTVVHWSGHGHLGGDLVLKGEQTPEHHIAPEHVATLLLALRRPPALIVFAASHSRRLAAAAARHARYAIGFDGELPAPVAPLFCATLYERLASRPEPDVPRAFKLARLATLAADHPSAAQACLFEHPGNEYDP